MPKVSIIIPVFNRSRYLEKCLDSVLNQTLSDIEVICVDDGSTDDSLSKLQNYALKDKRVKVISLEKNRGVSVARNIGIENATGEFLAFVDSDDFLDKQFYEKLYNKALETQADCAKGNIYNYDEKTGEISFLDFYDMNGKISQNKYYFYYGFTSGIYKTDIVQKNNIKFPENKSYFEDPLFNIKVVDKVNKVITVDDAKYYYLKHDNTLTSVINVENIRDVSKEILDYINVNIKNKTDYCIVFDFLIDHLFRYFESFEKEEKEKKEKKEPLVDAMDYCLIKGRYSTGKYQEVYTKIASKDRFAKYQRDLLQAYKRYDYLNQNPSQPFVKILVGYIKPSFLYKTNILTPIHLGRAVEEDVSKEGFLKREDFKWLHENCLGDDGFEGNISAMNRRVGFLTGTYWAWKNYEKLGNPDYFGFFGYRRLLLPYCLSEIGNYDLVFPMKMGFPTSLKEQLIDMHGDIYYKNMMDAIKAVYPDEYDGVKQYMEGQEGYFLENYIMKREFFFNFCQWIFKLCFYMLENCSFEEDKVNNSGIKNPEILKIINKNKERRDVAFLIERFTGYYFYRLTQNPKIKIQEVNVFENAIATKYKENFVLKEIHRRLLVKGFKKL